MQQKYLKNGGLIALITILSMIPPLSTDLYMPALPEMKEYFHTTSTLTSFTMTIFFIFMAIGILVLGSLSDKYGRKPVLLSSIAISITFSIACVFSPSIWLLIFFRAVQAFGAGGMVTIGTALIKDSFEGKKMSSVLSITQVFLLIAPMLAPILGALILKVASWKMTFIALAIITVISLIGAFLLQETLPTESTIQSILNMITVAKNKKFTSLLLVGGLLQAPFMAYLGIASFVYIRTFGPSETAFSIFFAIAAAASGIGPMLYMRFGLNNVKGTFRAGFIISTISALLLWFIGDFSPIVFLLSYIPFAITTMYLRPMVTDLLLSEQKSNIGAASSFLNFGFTVIGSIGMMIGSLNWPSFINGLSYTMLIFILLGFLIWIYIIKTNQMETIGNLK